jgi:hypothetical protein
VPLSARETVERRQDGAPLCNYSLHTFRFVFLLDFFYFRQFFWKRRPLTPAAVCEV